MNTRTNEEIELKKKINDALNEIAASKEERPLSKCKSKVVEHLLQASKWMGLDKYEKETGEEVDIESNERYIEALYGEKVSALERITGRPDLNNPPAL